jgi:hypothetical protein
MVRRIHISGQEDPYQWSGGFTSDVRRIYISSQEYLTSAVRRIHISVPYDPNQRSG